MVYSHIDTGDLEKFFRMAKKTQTEPTERCLQTLRRKDVEKVTNASLKTEIKRTECHDTRLNVVGFR